MSALIGQATDLALVVEEDGTVLDTAFGAGEIFPGCQGAWRGKSWVDLVTVESQTKVNDMLETASKNVKSKARQVNHPRPDGPDVPVLYTVVPLKSEGRVVALGRDLSDLADTQQRLLEAQNSIEREYAKLRHAETRYRLLFEGVGGPVLVLDATSKGIVEANYIADELIGASGESILGTNFADHFDAKSKAAVETFVAQAEMLGRAQSKSLKLSRNDDVWVASADKFRHENKFYLLINLVAKKRSKVGDERSRAEEQLFQAIQTVPDSFVLTNEKGQVIRANQAFLELVQVVSNEQVKNQSLERWVGTPGVDLNVLISNLQKHGAFRLFATKLRGEKGSLADVEISAAALSIAPSSYVFLIRDISHRLKRGAERHTAPNNSPDRLSGLVGRVPLKEIVKETTDEIERLCIEAALNTSGDNRAVAADMLGLSRQSLYTKLRRYGIAEFAKGD